MLLTLIEEEAWRGVWYSLGALGHRLLPKYDDLVIVADLSSGVVNEGPYKKLNVGRQYQKKKKSIIMNEDEEEGTKKIIEKKVIDEDKYDASSLLQHRKE